MAGLFDRLNRWSTGAPAENVPPPAPPGSLQEKLRIQLQSNLFAPQPASPAFVEQAKKGLFDPPKRVFKPAEVDPARAFTGIPTGVFKKKEQSETDTRTGVRRCPEFLRVQALPERTLDLARDLTAEFMKPGGTMQLWPIQSAMLHDARLANGLIAPVACGAGKTISSLLVGEALQSECTVLLVPPQLRDQLMNVDIPQLYQHWKIPISKIHVVSYSMLSSAKHQDILDRLKPDLIVADEAHNLRRQSVRTKRFLRYFKSNPGTRLVALSGTLTNRSLRDYAHLSELALRKGSPLPHWERYYSSLGEWAEAIDVPKRDEYTRSPGVLLDLLNDREQATYHATHDVHEAHSQLRGAFRRRLVATPGVVATSENELGVSLYLEQRDPHLPKLIEAELDRLRDTWTLGEEEFEDAVAMWRAARQLACGFYYRWDWPNNQPDIEWLLARAAWHKEIRDFLKHARPGCDSPMLYTRAVIEGEILSLNWKAWDAVRERKKPPTVPVWIHDFLIKDAIRFVNEDKTPCLVWYEHAAFGERLAKESGLPFCGPGEDASQRLRECATQGRSAIASIKAHGFGKNLHAYARAYVISPPTSGTTCEQLLARHHREGQQADEVRFHFALHTPEFQAALAQAVEDARYQQDTTGSKQKLLYATRVGW